MIYLDNAATSWHKPPEVLKAMTESLEHAGGNPGRSGHRLSIAAARIIYETREEIARLFNAADPLRVIFTGNVTHALNIVLRGLIKPGDRVVTTSMEHNAVMRPLRYLEKQGVVLEIVPCAPDGTLNTADLATALEKKTRLVVVNHASNVAGTLLPIAGVAALAHRSGALLLVDAAQSAGVMPIDIQADGIDLLAFTGHKGLQGPPGTGGLVISSNVDISLIEPLMRGGTGSRSELEYQPDELPDKFESGTANLAGIAGLQAGVRWIMQRGIESIRSHEQALSRLLLEGLSSIPGIRLYGTKNPEKSIAVISCTVAGKRVSEVGLRLDNEYDILSRVGLHCAPAAHRTIGTFPEGTVRLSPGVFTTGEDIEATIRALEIIAGS